ncbi:iron uptake porin [Scytonema hofmannii FACHB-248]|uniref:Iron uptake porin n=1 Tax=Scytonema hofmannii FACHB-248 TaxID=1842502 RepID=A0ABR8GPY4_9CYAN|nr:MULTISPECIES: iron uptake porin [Nostocales]MBD2605249.1 iron uptake porin [Scytonema hofmannii FACHB-248]
MKKPLWNVFKLSPLVVAASFLAANGARAAEVKAEVKEQTTSVSQLSQEANSIGQVTSVSQFSDVQPTDWAFQALQSLVERYGCIAGYPNGTYRGNRALTRYEFAAGLNACLDRVNELIATATADLVTKEDLATLQRLQEEFSAELATLRGRVDALEARTAELESNQFSTTTKLNGEVIFSVADVFTEERALPYNFSRGDFSPANLANPAAVSARIQQLNPGFTTAQANAIRDAYGSANFQNSRRDTAGNTVFADRVRLNFDTSFVGTDRLRVRIQARNISGFDTSRTGTNLTRLSYDGDENNAVVLDDLFYQFNLSDAVRVNISAARSEFYDFVDTVNPALASSGTGAISRYGRFSPIYRQASEGAGITVVLAPKSPITATVGYQAGSAENPDLGRGLINGSYSAFGQLAFKPSKAFTIAATYARTYQNSEGAGGVNLFSSTGNFNANRPFGNFATTTNNYGIEALIRPSSRFTLAGWVGYTTAEAEAGPFSGANADILYWAASLALQDFGKQGSTLGIIFGQPPTVISSDVIEDRDTTYHLEGLYKYQLNDNIAITPGLLVIFSPEGNSDNDTTYVGTLRTTFTF